MQSKPFDPSDFLIVAHELAGDGSWAEARLRTAVGRAYYSVFLQARDKLQIREKKGVHTKVIQALKRVDRAAGDQLDSLESLRGAADYEMTVNDPLSRDWRSNWHRARNYADHIARRLARLTG